MFVLTKLLQLVKVPSLLSIRTDVDRCGRNKKSAFGFQGSYCIVWENNAMCERIIYLVEYNEML